MEWFWNTWTVSYKKKLKLNFVNCGFKKIKSLLFEVLKPGAILTIIVICPVLCEKLNEASVPSLPVDFKENNSFYDSKLLKELKWEISGTVNQVTS